MGCVFRAINSRFNDHPTWQPAWLKMNAACYFNLTYPPLKLNAWAMNNQCQGFTANVYCYNTKDILILS